MRWEVRIYSTGLRVCDAGDDREGLARIVVRPIVERAERMNVAHLISLERIGPSAVVLVVAHEVDAVTIVVDGKDVLRSAAFVCTTEEFFEIACQ